LTSNIAIVASGFTFLKLHISGCLSYTVIYGGDE